MTEDLVPALQASIDMAKRTPTKALADEYLRLATNAAKQDSGSASAGHSTALVAALTAYLKAQCRMLERWAEGDQNVKNDLWKALHACEADARAALEKAKP